MHTPLLVTGEKAGELFNGTTTFMAECFHFLHVDEVPFLKILVKVIIARLLKGKGKLFLVVKVITRIYNKREALTGIPIKASA